MLPLKLRVLHDFNQNLCKEEPLRSFHKADFDVYVLRSEHVLMAHHFLLLKQIYRTCPRLQVHQ